MTTKTDTSTIETGTAGTDPPPTYEPPGPGSWRLDVDHQSTPRGRLFTRIFDDAYAAGFRTGFRRYGLPLETIRAASVNGWLYYRAVPAGAPDRGGPPPPAPVFKVLSRITPELRRRNRAARETLETKRWLTDTDAWRAERPAWEAEVRSLLTAPIDELDDDGLRRHAAAALDGATRIVERHFELVGTAVAIGRLFVAGDDWGLDRADVRSLLRGASPASADSAAPLRDLAELVRTSGVTPHDVDSLRAISSDVAAAVDDYLETWGWRVLDDDVEGITLAERPDLLVSLLVAADERSDDLDGRRRAIRNRVPEHERSRFDALLAEARYAYSCADDNSSMLSWMVGALRRAALEVARRCVADGRLNGAGDVWNLSADEFLDVAHGRRGPGPDELAQRASARRAAAEHRGPLVLGDAPHPPPDPAVFPPAMAELTRAIGVYLADRFTPETAGTPGPPATLEIDGRVVASGHGAGSGRATGKLVVVGDADDALDRLEPGDILACPYTTPGWNAVFPLLGGIVTSFGGPMGHTGVMAREFGIPALVGVGAIDPALDGAEATLTAD